ncbi:MAG: histidinol-phosphatase [Rudanella sp.]|nr:histidinol-phosphatase [Rudanella sp.]
MWEKLTHWLHPSDEPISTRMAALWAVDMHNHFVPGVDDGVTTVEETMQCLRQYAEWGIRRVISTPHISQDYYPNTRDQLLLGAETVEQAIAAENLPITFSVAAEYLLDEQFYDLLQNREILSFGTEQYVLVEMGWASAPHHLEQYLFTLQQKGYTPVLAHPERYRFYHDELDKLLDLHEKGCLFQLNLLSVTGRYGRSTQHMAQQLLKAKTIDFIASDLHRPADLEALPGAFTSSLYPLLLQQPLLNATLL